MKLAIYGDAHITRNMKSIQSHWNDSVISIFRNLYYQFSANDIEMAVCLGDLFDKAVLEARSVKLVTEVLSIINSAPFPTYVLLGNHEIDSTEHNVLEYLSEYDNIFPVTELLCLENKFTFVPYSVDIESLPIEFIKDKYLFTHHDIYGSLLAGGKVKASFGVDPNLFNESKYVFNGHIHLSSVLGKVHNVGSITKMQQGELVGGLYPKYYYLDTGNESSPPRIEEKFLLRNFIAHLTVTPMAIEDLLGFYDDSVKFVLRVSYSDEDELRLLSKSKDDPRILSITNRRILPGSIVDIGEETVHRSNLDMKQFLSNYIMKDDTVPAENKDNMITLGLSLLGE